MTNRDTDTAGTPRWVKVFAIVALLVVLLFVVLMLTGRGDHGPGRHAPSGDETPAGHGVGHRPPTGAHTVP